MKPESQLIGNMEVVKELDTLRLRFSRPFRRKALLILLAMGFTGIAMVTGGSRIVGGELDRFTVDLLLLVLGAFLLALSLWGLSHVARHSLRWTILDRKTGLFQHPGPLLGLTQTLPLSDILRVELCRKESSSEHPGGYGSVVERVGLILKNQRKPYFPWGTHGGPDRAHEISRLLSRFLAKHAPTEDDPHVSEASLDALLPPTAGPYVREELRGLEVSKGRTTYATYRMADVLVFVELGVCDDLAAARLAIETARSELSSEYPDAPLREEHRGDSLVLTSVNPRGALTAWTKGRYYYSAHTARGKSDLDNFLRILDATLGPTANPTN